MPPTPARWRSSADLFGQTLAAHGVGQVFTLVGAHINPLLAGCADAGLALIDTRHEACAGHAAEGFAKASGQIGVCVVTAGAGFSNVLTAMASCLADATPVLFVAGAPPLQAAAPNPLMGGYSACAVAAHLAKWVARAETAEQVPALLAQGMACARQGRPGPVFLEIPLDVALGQAAQPQPAASVQALPPPQAPHATQMAQVLARLAQARRPLILAGGGVKYAGAGAALQQFVRQSGIPLMSNLNTHGVLVGDDPAWAGPFSASWPLPAAADLLLVLGARLGLLTGGMPAATVVQVDIDASELRHLRAGDIGMAADCRVFLQALGQAWGQVADPGTPPERSAWATELRAGRQAGLARWAAAPRSAAIHPFDLAQTVVTTLPAQTVFVADGGDAKAWIEQQVAVQDMGQYVSRAYGGALGSGQGLALGAQRAFPGRPVCLFIGDGALGFQLQTLHCYARHALPIIVVIVNNGAWGSTRHDQASSWGPQRSLATELGNVDYAQIAQALGCAAERINTLAALAPALHRALARSGPSVLDVWTDPNPDPNEGRGVLGSA